ncbi:hypothetical protein FRC08_005838, partial [Ceratobasidium sp. 394]
SIATLATVYPADFRDVGLANHPFALMEYYADYHKNGSLTYLFFPISQNSRNIASASRNTASFTIRAGESGGYLGEFAPAVLSEPGQVPMTKSNAGWWNWDWRRSFSLGRGPAASARVALMGRVNVMYGITGEGESEGEYEVLFVCGWLDTLPTKQRAKCHHASWLVTPTPSGGCQDGKERPTSHGGLDSTQRQVYDACLGSSEADLYCTLRRYTTLAGLETNIISEGYRWICIKM